MKNVSIWEFREEDNFRDTSPGYYIHSNKCNTIKYISTVYLSERGVFECLNVICDFKCCCKYEALYKLWLLNNLKLLKSFKLLNKKTVTTKWNFHKIFICKFHNFLYFTISHCLCYVRDTHTHPSMHKRHAWNKQVQWQCVC